MKSRKAEILYSVYSLLQYHQGIGVTDYPLGGAVTSFLEAADATQLVGPDIREIPQESQNLQNIEDVPPTRRTSITYEGIAGEVCSCTGCVLHAKRLSVVPGVGSTRHPKLLIVGGWLVEEQGDSLPEGSIFGGEEDGMVSRMLAAIHLSPEEAFITNVVKCTIPGDCHPDHENINTCFSFLKQQIQVLKPEIICTMGIVAAKALVKNSQSLSQLRGKLYSFTLSERETIPVIPTYHPTFLLANPEFKRATWEDLQIIAKYLKLEKDK